jgi:CHAT domain-containing protein
MASISQWQEKHNQALQYYEAALPLFQSSDDAYHIAGTLRNLSLTHTLLGNNEQAQTFLEQSIEHIEDIAGLQYQAMLTAEIGVLYLVLGEYEQARDSFEQVLALYKQIGDRDGEAFILGAMGETYNQERDMERALEYYQQSLAINEELRQRVALEELKISFAGMDTFVEIYQQTMLLLMRLDRPVDAFNMSERARARAFLDQIGNPRIDFRTGADTALIKQEQTLRAELTTLRKNLQTEQNDQIADSIEERITEKQQEHRELLTNLKLEHPEYANLVSVSPLELPGIQQLLDKDTTLLSYYIASEQTFAFVLTRDTFHTVALDAGVEELTSLVRTLRSAPDVINTPPGEATTLYNTLIAPLKEHLSTPHLAIIPHSVLHYLPFAVLSPDGTRYLIDDYTLTLLPNATTLQYIQQNTSGKSDTALILGNPTTPITRLATLPGAEQEAQTIATLYDTQPLIGADATEEAVHTRATEAGVLHLAAHGEFYTTNPLYSTIALAPDDDGAYDGLLEVHEVYSLDLQQTDMVVLSACETRLPHMGKENVVSGGDEIVGLTRAFMYAGTPTVISTLWQVPDESSRMLMERFYTRYRSGMGKASALRQAQLDVRQQYPHFRHWAGFVLSGDGGEVAENASVEDPAAEPTPVEATAATAPTSGGGSNSNGSCLSVGFILAVGLTVTLATRQRRKQ